MALRLSARASLQMMTSRLHHHYIVTNDDKSDYQGHLLEFLQLQINERPLQVQVVVVRTKCHRRIKANVYFFVIEVPYCH